MSVSIYGLPRGGGKIKDATALPSDVLNGKIFYNNNGRQVGTLNQIGYPLKTLVLPTSDIGSEGEIENYWGVDRRVYNYIIKESDYYFFEKDPLLKDKDILVYNETQFYNYVEFFKGITINGEYYDIMSSTYIDDANVNLIFCDSTTDIVYFIYELGLGRFIICDGGLGKNIMIEYY